MSEIKASPTPERILPADVAFTRKTFFKLLGGLVIVVAIGLGVWAWMALRVEEIPDELATMERSPDELVVPSLGDTPDLRVAHMRGERSFIVLEGIQSMRAEQGKEVNRALNRWVLPDTTKGYIVYDAQGMRVFEDKVRRFTEDFFAQEVRYPLYADFDGETLDVFKLIKGHHGLVVLDENGEVLMRHSGGFKADELDELREMLGAQEPPEPPPAPQFAAADLTQDSCKQKPCLFLFLGKKVARTDIPWIEDGFEGNRTDSFERMHRPEIRLAASAMQVPIKKSHGVIFGDLQGLEPEGWRILPDEPSLREAFGIEAGQSALVVIDTQGRLAFKETEFIPMYRWTLAIDITGESIKRGDDDS